MPRKNLLDDSGRPPAGWLRVRRDEQALSLQAVADRLDVSPQAVHQFEHGEVTGTISLRQLARVADALGARVSYCLEPKSPRTPPPPPPPPAPTAGRIPAPVRSAHEASPRPASAAEPAQATIAQSLFLDNQDSGRFD